MLGLGLSVWKVIVFCAGIDVRCLIVYIILLYIIILYIILYYYYIIYYTIIHIHIILYIIYYIIVISYTILFSSPLFLSLSPLPLNSIKGIHLSMFKGYTSISNNPSLRNPSIFNIHLHHSKYTCRELVILIYIPAVSNLSKQLSHG